jgi:hypothetical protein
MDLLRRPTTGEIVEDGRLGRPCGPDAHSRAISENQFAAPPPFHLNDSQPRTDWLCGTNTAGYRCAGRAAEAKRVVVRGQECDDPWSNAVIGLENAKCGK